MRGWVLAYNLTPTIAVGEMVSSTYWNTYVRDGGDHFADDHDHGSATHGSTSLGASGGLTSIRLSDGSDPAAPGAGKTIIYSKSGKLYQRVGASGSPEEFSIVGHTH